jgi:hypothetical protein
VVETEITKSPAKFVGLVHFYSAKIATRWRAANVSGCVEDFMSIESCVPVIPSEDIKKSLGFWIDGLGFGIDAGSEVREDGKLVFCMIHRDAMCFMLNRRAGTAVKPEHYEGIRFYWTPSDIRETRRRLKDLGYAVSEIVDRYYGQTEFVTTDDDGFSHCFGIATAPIMT